MQHDEKKSCFYSNSSLQNLNYSHITLTISILFVLRINMSGKGAGAKGGKGGKSIDSVGSENLNFKP